MLRCCVVGYVCARRLIDDASFPAIARTITRFLEDGTLTQLEHASVGIAPSTMHQLFLYN